MVVFFFFFNSFIKKNFDSHIFIHQISWVVLKFQWQKFEQNRKAKALQPADCCCTRSPRGRSGSALTCSFLSKKLSCRGLGNLPTRWAGAGQDLPPGWSSVTQLHPSQGRARWGPSILSHTKSLAIYANVVFPVNKPNPIAQCLVLVLASLAGFRCQGFHFQGYKKYFVEMRHQTTRSHHLAECVLCGWFGWRCNHSTPCDLSLRGHRHSGSEGSGRNAAASGQERPGDRSCVYLCTE